MAIFSKKCRHRAVVRHRLLRPFDGVDAVERKIGFVTKKVKQVVLLQFSQGKASFYQPFSKVKQLVLLLHDMPDPLCLSAFQRGLDGTKSKVELGGTLRTSSTSVIF